jgi:pimeloyl-ACP methyl ester carboxylesterase
MKVKLFAEQNFHCTETTLSYVEGPPRGRPFLLIHGVTSRWQPFQSILPALAEKYHVYALDLRGHGQSSHRSGAYHLDDYTRDVYQFINECIQAPVIIYGHSLGALIAINLAAQNPQHVSALILGDPPLYYHNTLTRDTFWYEAFIELLEFIRDYPSSAEMESRLLQIAPNMTTERREERIRSLEGLDPDVVRTIIADELIEGISLSALAHRVVCPVLLLRGNEKLGSALRDQDVDFAISHFQNIRVLNMDSIGHGIIPSALLPQMIDFVESIGRTQGNS